MIVTQLVTQQLVTQRAGAALTLNRQQHSGEGDGLVLTLIVRPFYDDKISRPPEYARRAESHRLLSKWLTGMRPKCVLEVGDLFRDFLLYRDMARGTTLWCAGGDWCRSARTLRRRRAS